MYLIVYITDLPVSDKLPITGRKNTYTSCKHYMRSYGAWMDMSKSAKSNTCTFEKALLYEGQPTLHVLDKYIN